MLLLDEEPSYFTREVTWTDCSLRLLKNTVPVGESRLLKSPDADNCLLVSDEAQDIRPLEASLNAIRDFASLLYEEREIVEFVCWFPRGIEPVFPPRSEPPLSMVF
jgi:hypothetical protein